MNRYTYAMNNPLGLTDPSGLSVYVCDEGGSCGWVSDSDYAAAQGADQFNHAPGLGNSGNIYGDNGNIVGTAQYFNDGNLGLGLGYGYGSGGVVIGSASGSSNVIPWYKNTCVTSALGKGAATVGFDSIGLIPEAGGVARIIGHGSGYVGVVADQAGGRVVKAAGKSTDTVRGLNGLTDTSPEGMLSTGLTVAGFHTSCQ